MNKKSILVYMSVGIVLIVMMFLTFNSSDNYKNSLGASLSANSNYDEEVITAAKLMVIDNMSKYSDNETVELTIKDLVSNNYLTGSEINPATGKEYKDNVRVIVVLKDKSIEDVYVKNDLFKNVLSCEDTCYLNENNYIAFNNDVYRIIKIDQDGYLYITNYSLKSVLGKNIDTELKNISNQLDKSVVSNVVSISENDINNTDIDIEKDLFVNGTSGYKKYSINNNTFESINESEEADLLPIIVLRNDLSYDMGTGTKFNPYILTE